MTQLLKAIRLAVVKFQIRSLEITLDGQCQALETVRDPITRRRIEAAREDVRRDLTKTRAKYSAMLPVGQRTTWNMA